MCIKSAIILFFVVFSQQVLGAEPGYAEAMKYFVFREKNRGISSDLKVSKEGASQELVHKQNPKEIKPKKQKFYLGLGVGDKSAFSYYNIQLGASFVKTKFFQQSLSLEYNKSKQVDAMFLSESERAEAIYMFQNLHFSSTLFFLSPEVDFGLGYQFGDLNRGGVVAIKTGLNFSNRWTKAYMLSFSFLYRRDQFISNNSYNDGIEFSLRMGI